MYLDLFEAVKVIHQLGIVHNDINPPNIMLNKSINQKGNLNASDFDLILIDYGISQKPDEPYTNGNPHYMHP